MESCVCFLNLRMLLSFGEEGEDNDGDDEEIIKEAEEDEKAGKAGGMSEKVEDFVDDEEDAEVNGCGDVHFDGKQAGGEESREGRMKDKDAAETAVPGVKFGRARGPNWRELRWFPVDEENVCAAVIDVEGSSVTASGGDDVSEDEGAICGK